MDEFEKQLLDRLKTAKSEADEARTALGRAMTKISAIESLLDAEGYRVPGNIVKVATLSASVAGTGHVTRTGYAGMGFRQALFDILSRNPQGMRAKEIADWLESSDFEFPEDAKTDLTTRVANECSKLVRKNRLQRAERGVFILPKKESPDAATSGLFGSSANGSTTDAGGSDQQGGY